MICSSESSSNIVGYAVYERSADERQNTKPEYVQQLTRPRPLNIFSDIVLNISTITGKFANIHQGRRMVMTAHKPADRVRRARRSMKAAPQA